MSKPVTLQTSPAKQSRVNLNKNVIAPGMYKVVTTQESQTNEAKHNLSSTRMNAASSVRRPMNKDSHVKNSVLANSKKPARKPIYPRKSEPPKSYDTTYVVRKTRFSKESTLSKSLDTTYVVSKPKIDVGSTSKANSIGHNLFSVGQFCDGDLEVAFRSNTCYVRNLEEDDLLTGDRESNLYTISISDMTASSPVYLISKATSTKS
ncbi:hypothetical protein Tco_1401773 [Tanacetum coccineum]